MKNVLILGLSTALAVTACNKSDSNAGSPNATASSRASGAAPAGGAAAGAELGPSSLEVSWTGKFDAEEYPLMRVTNKDTTRPLTYYMGFFYFYDHDKKQVGREFRDRYQISIKPGQSEEIGAGSKKSELPKGTEFIEFVVTGANFGSEAAKFRVATPPPEARPMGG
jgi:hypothetical protein